MRSPFWLRGEEIEIIDRELNQRVSLLEESQQKKVTALLYSITYAEKWSVRRKAWMSRWVGYFFSPQRSLSKRKVSNISTRDMADLPGLVDHLVRQVGLQKPAPSILAEYHSKELVRKQGIGLLPWVRFIFKPPRIQDHSCYVEDGMEAYHYVLKD